MNCAWCGKNYDGSGSHGICDACMVLYFGVNPARVHAEMAAEETQMAATSGNKRDHSKLGARSALSYSRWSYS